MDRALLVLVGHRSKVEVRMDDVLVRLQITHREVQEQEERTPMNTDLSLACCAFLGLKCLRHNEYEELIFNIMIIVLFKKCSFKLMVNDFSPHESARK